MWLKSFLDPTGMLARWLERLSAFNYTVIHRPGSSHANADGLSCLPECTSDLPLADAVVTVGAVSCETQSIGDSCDSNWCPSRSSVDLSAAQLADSDLSIMIGWQQAFLDRPQRRDSTLVGASHQL